MNYRFNNVDLNTFSFVAGRQQESDIALSGFLDLPVRTGKTFHNWLDEHGVEPYVASNDIAFAGRDLSLVGLFQGTDRIDCLSKINVFQNFIKDQIGLIEFSCDWGVFQVRVTSISTTFHGDTLLEVTITMHEPVVDINALIPVADNGSNAIDGISLKSLGAFVLSAGKSWISEMKENSFYLPSVTEAPDFEMELLFEAASFADLNNNIKAFRALIASPGTRLLTMKVDAPREFFVHEGMQVSSINVFSGQMTAIVKLKAIELEFAAGYSFYIDDNMNLFSVAPENATMGFELNDNSELIMTIN